MYPTCCHWWALGTRASECARATTEGALGATGVQAVREAADEEKGAGRQGGQGDCSELSVTDNLIYFTSRRRHVVIGVTTASPQATGVTHVARAKLPL